MLPIHDDNPRVNQRRPWVTYALIAILTLALGVGGTSAVYSIIRRPLWEPLPYERADEVVQFWNSRDWSEAEFVMPTMG